MAYRANNPLWPTDESFQALLGSLQYAQKSRDEDLAVIAKPDATDKELRWAIPSQRNKQNVLMVDALLTFLRDTSRKPEQRVTTAETLGWYMFSFRKADIVAACREIYATEQDPAVRKALRQQANAEIAAMLQKETDDTLDKVLFELSSQMKNAYSRSDA